MSYLDASRFTDRPVSDRSLTVRDRHNEVRDTDVGTQVKLQLHCGERGLFVSRCIGSEVDCPFIRIYEEVEYKKELPTLVRHSHGQLVPKMGLSFVFLGHSFKYLYFAEGFD